jgi:hypothetical protein
MLHGMQGPGRFCRISAAMTAKTHNTGVLGTTIAAEGLAPDYFGGGEAGPGAGDLLDR